MLTLEEIKKPAVVSGIDAVKPVRIVATELVGENALTVYYNSANNRYWFDVRPNLRREMEGRKRLFNTKEHIVPEVKTRVQTAMTATVFAGIHVFTGCNEVPDDWRMHLVVLAPDKSFSRVAPAFATAAAMDVYAQAQMPAKRAAQQKVVEMVRTRVSPSTSERSA
jgi:hypothetical protein